MSHLNSCKSGIEKCEESCIKLLPTSHTGKVLSCVEDETEFFDCPVNNIVKELFKVCVSRNINGNERIYEIDEVVCTYFNPCTVFGIELTALNHTVVIVFGKNIDNKADKYISKAFLNCVTVGKETNTGKEIDTGCDKLDDIRDELISCPLCHIREFHILRDNFGKKHLKETGAKLTEKRNDVIVNLIVNIETVVCERDDVVKSSRSLGYIACFICYSFTCKKPCKRSLKLDNRILLCIVIKAKLEIVVDNTHNGGKKTGLCGVTVRPLFAYFDIKCIGK